MLNENITSLLKDELNANLDRREHRNCTVLSYGMGNNIKNRIEIAYPNPLAPTYT